LINLLEIKLCLMNMRSLSTTLEQLFPNGWFYPEDIKHIEVDTSQPFDIQRNPDVELKSRSSIIGPFIVAVHKSKNQGCDVVICFIDMKTKRKIFLIIELKAVDDECYAISANKIKQNNPKSHTIVMKDVIADVKSKVKQPENTNKLFHEQENSTRKIFRSYLTNTKDDDNCQYIYCGITFKDIDFSNHAMFAASEKKPSRRSFLLWT